MTTHPAAVTITESARGWTRPGTTGTTQAPPPSYGVVRTTTHEYEGEVRMDGGTTITVITTDGTRWTVRADAVTAWTITPPDHHHPR